MRCTYTDGRCKEKLSTKFGTHFTFFRFKFDTVCRVYPAYFNTFEYKFLVTCICIVVWLCYNTRKKRLLKNCIRQKYLASFVSFVVMIIYHCSKPSRTKKNVSQRKNVGNNKVCPVCSLKMCGFKFDYFRFISKFGFQ